MPMIGHVFGIHIRGVNRTRHWKHEGPLCQIIVVSQKCLLMKIKRKEPEKPKRPIGFASWDEYEKAMNKAHNKAASADAPKARAAERQRSDISWGRILMLPV